MEASLSRLLPSTPKTKLTLKRPLETDGGDSSSDEDDLYADNDTSLGREAKALYQSVARQCATDFQKEKREAFKRIQSDVSKFSLGKKMCVFVYQNGPLKGKRCEKQRDSRCGKYCSFEHKRQVDRRGKPRGSKKKVIPSGETIFVDNKGTAHGEPQSTPEEDELMARFKRLSATPALPAPPPVLALPAPTVQRSWLQPPTFKQPIITHVDSIEEIDDKDYDTIDYSKFVAPPSKPAPAPVLTNDMDAMDIEIAQQIAEGAAEIAAKEQQSTSSP